MNDVVVLAERRSVRAAPFIRAVLIERICLLDAR